VGSGGIMLPNHAPLIVAEQFGTLEILYPNRIDLGLGRAPGTDGLTAQAIRKDFHEQSQRFPENVAALQNFFSKDNAAANVRAFPAEGTHVPIWILGSSMDSAALAATNGLAYAFAGHFAPKQMNQAFQFYRDNFEPSKHLDKPKTMACVNAIVADTDKEAEKLATSLTQMFLNLIRNDRKALQPPIDSLDGIMTDQEYFHINQMTACSFVGSRNKVKLELAQFVNDTKVDELMVTSPIFNHQDKLKSIQLLKQVVDTMQTTSNDSVFQDK
jgi:luciferase family oxidoreductase group 1